MIAVDTNILVYAHREESPFYEKAYNCIRDLAEGSAPWAIPWPCIHEFFAIVTHPKIYDPPSPPKMALAQIKGYASYCTSFA
jgi:predicted nucleic acid-binding protein